MALPFYGQPLGILDQMLEEIGKLKQAQQLLDDVYSELGPYQNGNVSDVTWRKVCDYHDFEDSE